MLYYIICFKMHALCLNYSQVKIIVIYAEAFSMHHYVKFLQIGSQIDS